MKANSKIRPMERICVYTTGELSTIVGGVPFAALKKRVLLRRGDAHDRCSYSRAVYRSGGGIPTGRT